MEHANTAIGQGTNRPTKIMDRLRESTTAQLSQQKDRATDGLGSVAQAVRQSTRQLRDQQHGTIAQYVEQAADQLDKLSTRLREKNVNELVSDAQRFARQRPALFIGAAFAVGLLGARFLKSSSNRNDDFDARPYAMQPTSIPATGYGGAGYTGTEVR